MQSPPEGREAWGLTTACFEGESSCPPWGAQTSHRGLEGCLTLKSMPWGCRTGCLVYLMSLVGLGKVMAPFPVKSKSFVFLVVYSSMEVGISSDVFKTDVSCSRSLLSCSGTLCKLITAGGFWVWVTHSHFFLKPPVLCTPLFFPRAANRTLVHLYARCSELAVPWLL